MAIHPVFIQAGYYGVVMVLTLFILSVVQRGFLWKFLKVKTSFGRYIMVQIRTIHRDYFHVGWINEGFLCYKVKRDKRKSIIRHSIKDKNVFFRALGVTWVIVDEETNALLKHDLSGVSGYDAVKYDDLITRAIEAPKINSLLDKLLLAGMILLLILIGIAIAIIIKQNADITLVKDTLMAMKQSTDLIPKPAPI